MSDIPEPKREAVQRALDATFPGLTLDAPTRMVGGASGAGIFRLEAEGRPWLLRIEGPTDGLKDPRRQYACIAIAAEAGVAPAARYTNAEDGVAIMAFIEGLPPLEIPREERLVMIGRSLATQHATPLFPALVPYMEAMGFVMQHLASAAVLPTDVLSQHLAQFATLAAAYPTSDVAVVSSHNDLNPSNILYADGRAWFVDWETAFAADCYVDLAAVANFHGLDEPQEDLLLATYFGRPATDQERARLFLMKQINRYFYGAMLVALVGHTRPGTTLTREQLEATPSYDELRAEIATLVTDEGKLKFGAAYLNDVTRAMATPRFPEAAALAKAKVTA